MKYIYDYLFGNEESDSLFNSSEKEFNDNIKYPQNSLSSLAYILCAIYSLSNSSDNYLTLFLLFILGFVSFFWWASKRKIIHNYDILLYSLMIIYISFLILFKNNLINFDSLCYLTMLFIILIKILLFFEKFKIIKIINIISGFFSALLLIFYNQFIVLSIMIISIFFKLNDGLQIIKYNFLLSGTAWFHILTAIGYYYLINN